MKLQRLEVEGFRSFRAPLVLDFGALQPGLYHVTGRNEVEPTLEGNGVGKSSLFEAVQWVLYGRTSRGLQAGAVKTWDAKVHTGGMLSLVGPAGPVTVLRTWSPNTLEVAMPGEDIRPVDQPEAERLVGLTPEQFTYAVHFAQFVPSFADLRPAEQTALFSNVLQLQNWEAAADRARDSANADQQALQLVRETYARLQGEADALLASEHEAAAQQWERERAQRLQEARKRLPEAQKAVQAAKTRHAAASQATGAFLKADQAATTAHAAYQAAERESARLAKELNRLEADDLTHCPTCGQPLNDNKHLKAEVKRVRGEWQAAVKEANRLQKAFAVAMDEREQHLSAGSDKEETAVELQRAETEVQHLQANISSIQLEKNPNTAEAQRVEKRAMELAGLLEGAAEEMTLYERRIASAQFWVKGFRELRLSLIRESLAQLSVEANEALFALGLQDWGLQFDVESETKSGGVRRMFSILVQSPHTQKPVPWEAWSGGESQRLRLSVAMGFANLVCARAGVAPNIEFWDEPSQWLSGMGIHDLLQVLAERARRLGKVLLLADHRALDFGGFAGQIMLVKDKNGSRLAV